MTPCSISTDARDFPNAPLASAAAVGALVRLVIHAGMTGDSLASAVEQQIEQEIIHYLESASQKED